MPLEFPNVAYILERPHHIYVKKDYFPERALTNNLPNALSSEVLTEKMEMTGHPG